MSNMGSATKAIGIGAVVLVGVLVLGVACGSGAFTRSPAGVEQEQQPDGDCDAGDLRESKPDPDCNGLWLGTPTPGAKKTPGTVKKTPITRRSR